MSERARGESFCCCCFRKLRIRFKQFFYTFSLPPLSPGIRRHIFVTTLGKKNLDDMPFWRGDESIGRNVMCLLYGEKKVVGKEMRWREEEENQSLFWFGLE